MVDSIAFEAGIEKKKYFIRGQRNYEISIIS
jgi:hypothetical protein